MSDTVSTSPVGKVCPQCGTEYPFEQRFCPNDGTTLRAKNATGDLVGTIIADRYHVVKKLGEGGMGQVYLAEHVKMGRKSAVKVMNPGMTQDPDAISRFNREASNASRINHPNVAAIYDFGETPEGIIYLAMEYVEGDSLTKVIETNGALPPKRAGHILRQAGEALAVAHGFDIVHRDLKPDNIMIARAHDSGDLVKVVDFGIAKAGNAENQKVTKTGLVVGTPEYMSPEQLAGDKLDGRSDIYSLGLVAFNMLTGKLPFPSETVQESMIMRLTDRPRTLAEMHPQIGWPQTLQDVMDKALARSAKDRYQSASQFGRDFAAAVEGMSDLHPAEAGTQVIGAPVVPDTRIAPARPSTGGGAGATVKQGAVSAPAETRKSKTPLVLGGAVTGVAVVFAAIMALKGGPNAPAADSAVTPDTIATSQQLQGASNPVAPGPAAGKQVEPIARPTGSATKTPVPSTPAGTPGASLDEQLERAVTLTDITKEANEATARQALEILSDLVNQLSGTRKARALLARGNAFLLVDDLDNACRAFRDARPVAEGTALERPIAAYFDRNDPNAPCK